jgi:hypothetical protein
MRKAFPTSVLYLILLFSGVALAALVVPTDIEQPGTQPGEVGNLESPDKCDNCHGGYNTAVEPAHNWRGGMMANAGRDPVFWATVAVAEQDFDGSGDLCIRCHSTGGWYGGRSPPTDGSGLAAGAADGVDCDTCHKMTNPDRTEHAGVMNAPYIANDKQTPATGYHGSGMLALSNGNAKLGPYSDAAAKHQFAKSNYHRSVDFCGSCHDVSNPAVGDLAHNNGRQPTSDPVTANGTPGSPVAGKAAFNNFPFQYGIVERTFSEYKAGSLSKTPITSYASLPADLKAGAILKAKTATDVAGNKYADGTTRYFSCQTCHVPPVTGVGANKSGTPTRTDLPHHDMTGGNYWAADAILYQNTQNTLRLGGGMTAGQIAAVNAGKTRAQQQLQLAASMSVNGNTLKVVNLTGHKLISGYPEGRRMWLNIKWYGPDNSLLREDGAYGPITATVNGSPTQVKTILNPDDPNTRVYEAHYGMTKEWASQLISLGYSSSLALSYDRVTGAVTKTLGQLAAQDAGTYHNTFHFVLNNKVTMDNRIPPYGFAYDEARKRNALPVPATQYGNAGPGGTFNYWDAVTLNPPTGAATAQISLMYQPTSWEYIQFLYLANNKTNTFLANEGTNLLNAWLNTGMAEPYVMTTTSWTAPPPPVKLAIATQPGNGVANTTLSPFPAVVAQYGDGSTASGYTGPITLAIKSGTGTAGAVLNGTTTVNAVNGVATFSDLSIDSAGIGYVLTATSGGITPADTTPFNIAFSGVPGKTVTSPSASSDGTVYYGATDGVLHGVSASTGASVFYVDTRLLGAFNGARQLLGRPIRRPWQGVEKVFCVTDDGYLGCFGLDGSTTFFEKIPLSLSSVTAVPMAQDDVLWVAVWDGTDTWLVKRDTAGSMTTTNMGPTTGEPGSLSVFGSSIFLGTTTGAYRVLADGTIANTIATSASTGSPFVASTGTVANPNPSPRAYVVTDSGLVTCCNAFNGTINTEFGGTGTVDLGIIVGSGKKVSGNLFAYNNRIYIGGMDNKVYSLDSLTGSGAGPGGSKVFFDAGAGFSIVGSVAIDPCCKGSIVFGSTDNSVYQVNLANPADYLATDFGSPFRTTPAIDRTSQTVHIGADGGFIYRLPSY